MKNNKYKITLQEIELRDGNEANKSLEFEFENHDNILNLIEKVQEKGMFENKDENTQFVLGLKLFSEIMMTHRNSPLFEGFLPAFGEFMKKLKNK